MLRDNSHFNDDNSDEDDDDEDDDHPFSVISNL